MNATTVMTCPITKYPSTLRVRTARGKSLKCLRENLCRPYGTRTYLPFTQHSACGCVLG